MTLPNFLLIGAQKSGTSSLFRYLKTHPQVFMSHIKEPKFFALESEDFDFKAPYQMPDTVARIAERERYEALFGDVGGATAVGEGSTWYLHTPSAPAKIKEHVPQMKLIAILREPVTRAHSNFLHNRNYLKIEPHADFAAAIAAEEERRQKEWGHPWYYVHNGRYYTHLKRYFDTFGSDQIRVYLMEDLKADPETLLRDVYQFLGVDADFLPDFSQRFNVSAGTTKSESVSTFLDKPHPLKTLLKPLFPERLRRRLKFAVAKQNRAPRTIETAVRTQIIQAVREDVLQLQTLLDRDLSHWLKA